MNVNNLIFLLKDISSQAHDQVDSDNEDDETMPKLKKKIS